MLLRRFCRMWGLVLSVCLLAGLLAGCGGSGSAGKEAEWAKSHWDNGVLYVYTVDPVPGTGNLEDGTERPAELTLCRDKDGFAAQIEVDDGGVYWNASGSDAPMEISVVAVGDSGSEVATPVSGMFPAGNALFNIDGTGTAFIVSLLEGKGRLEIDVLGSSFRFSIVGGDKYDEIWTLAAPYSYMPTYTDELYDGKDVNPELKSFLDKFEADMMASLEYRKQFSGRELLLFDILDYNESPQLKSDYAWYRLIDQTPSMRKVDAEYYYDVRERIDAALLQAGVREGKDMLDFEWDVLDGLARFFGGMS